MKSKVQRTIASTYTIEQRIANCAPLNQSKKVECESNEDGCLWSLVARKRDAKTGIIKEVWKDTTSGMILGDVLDKTYDHYNAETACGTEDGKVSVAGIKEKTFGLPSKEDFRRLEENGFREALASMKNNLFWSWVVSYSPGSAYVFRGDDGSIDFYHYRRDSMKSVLCVGR